MQKSKFIRKVKKGRKFKVTDLQIKKALRKSHGLLTHGAKKLGISYQCLRNRLAASESLQKAVGDIQERNLDFSESQLRRQIRKGNLTAIIFHLKCKGKARGYVERFEQHVSTPDEDRPSLSQKEREAALNTLSVSELRQLLEITEKLELFNNNAINEKETK